MIDRFLKAAVAASIGLMALLYVLHNIANIGPAHDFFVYSTSHADQQAYPVTLLPVPPDALVWIAMILVFALEAAAGVLGLYGAFAMFRVRKGDAASFAAAKRWAKIAMGCAVVNWWGLFQGLAVAGYQLWQMPLGGGPDHGSWQYGAMAILALIYLSLGESDD